MGFDPESEVRGSLVAVGSMQPIIEVWDLDIVDCLEPAFKLGRKGSKKKKISRIGHTDAVLSLSWNSSLGHVLGSGSVDQSCLLWDLSTQQVAAHLGRGEGRHREKVQAVQFHPFQAHSMATGCCDAKVRVFDCRSPDSPTHSWGVGGEVERVVWDHFNPHRCLASTDQGTVLCLDSRQPDKPAWTLSAHSEAVTGLSLYPQVPGLVTTVSTDSVLKVWDCGETDSAQPVYVTERDLKMGQLHAVQSCPDAPFVVCMGGDKRDNNFKVLDVRESAPEAEVRDKEIIKSFANFRLWFLYCKRSRAFRRHGDRVRVCSYRPAVHVFAECKGGGGCGGSCQHSFCQYFKKTYPRHCV